MPKPIPGCSAAEEDEEVPHSEHYGNCVTQIEHSGNCVTQIEPTGICPSIKTFFNPVNSLFLKCL
jgi:hypothetical protein